VDSARRNRRRVRELIDGTAPKDAVAAAVKALAAAAPPPVPPGGVNPFVRPAPGEGRNRDVHRHLAAATILRAAKRFDEAGKAYADAVTSAILHDAGTDPTADPAGSRAWVYGTSD